MREYGELLRVLKGEYKGVDESLVEGESTDGAFGCRFGGRPLRVS